MHPALETVNQALAGTPFEADVYLVGGAVRDQLLGLPVSDDLDLVTTGSAASLSKLLWEQGYCDFFPVTYERFGTAMVSIRGVKVEIVTARKESYSTKSRKPAVRPGTLLEDAQRRDFTVNALLQPLNSDSILDPLGTGLDDLRRGLLRTPLDPKRTFHDDPLRMLRAVRFRHRFGFTYAEDLESAIKSSASRLKIISKERIRDELVKILLHASVGDALADLLRLDLLKHFLPEFLPCVGCEQGKWHHLDVWDHSRLVVANVHRLREDTPDILTLLAALFHDIAKPETRSEEQPGKVHFYQHEVVGAAMAKRILRRLKFPNSQIEVVARLVKNHMRLGCSPKFTDAAARRLLRDLGEDVWRLLDLCEADANGLKAGVRVLDVAQVRNTVSRVESYTPQKKLDSPLSGEEIMELTGLPEGARIGELKSHLIEAVLEGEVTSPLEAREWLTQLLQEGK